MPKHHNIVTHESNFPIQPCDIDTPPGGHFGDAFGNNETEISARYIVRLCKQKGDWRPFTYEEIEGLYSEAGHKGFIFNRLIEPGMEFYIQRGRVPVGGGWIVKRDGLYYVTDDFIKRCHKSAPVKK